MDQNRILLALLFHSCIPKAPGILQTSRVGTVTNLVLRASSNFLVAPSRILMSSFTLREYHNGLHVKELQISQHNKAIRRFFGRTHNSRLSFKYFQSHGLLILCYMKSLRMKPECRNMQESLYVLTVLYYEVHFSENVLIKTLKAVSTDGIVIPDTHKRIVDNIKCNISPHKTFSNRHQIEM
jgi:hypothetical protein